MYPLVTGALDPMKFMYIVSVPPLPAIVLDPRLTQMMVFGAVLLAPLSIHASNTVPVPPEPVVNSTLEKLEFAYV